MDDLKLKDRASSLMFKFIQVFEIVVSVIITVVIIFMIYNLISSVIQSNVLTMTSSDFSNFLSAALTLVVGLEFVKLLCQHTPENLIEVLMLAISRQMVVEHLDTFQMLLGVISIIGLLAAKKYLTDSKAKKAKDCE
ncbi:transporter [Lachnospiraceae bacterium NSJ-143]|nr:transporter [Lachnospiraceae bacterium NSJ-143]